MKNKSIIAISLLSLMIVGCSSIYVKASDPYQNKDLDSIFGSITVDSGAKVGDISSINGGVHLAQGASAESIDVINGGVTLGDNVNVIDVETINGSIDAGEFLQVSQSLETINGSVDVLKGGIIKGSIITINGDINLNQSLVEKNIETQNGDIKLTQATVVKGDLIIEDSDSWFDWFPVENRLVIEIDATSSVEGRIILYKPVELKIHSNAKHGRIERHYSRH